MTAPVLVEHFFRREYGKLIAVLSNRVGVHNLEAIEDAAQSALMSALSNWTTQGLPENPSAWLFRVANNQLVDELRNRSNRARILATTPQPGPDESPPPSAFLPEEVRDDLLRMLFVCCDESVPLESQLVLALKTLCGFSVGEIAGRLFTTTANVYKRLARARDRLRELEGDLGDLSGPQYSERLPRVHKVLHLLFTEGYLSSHAQLAIRRELCDEALRLTTLLAEHPAGQRTDTFALLALMHLHTARLTARQDGAGELLLLEEQDRSLWDQEQIRVGLVWLARSAHGDLMSRYHAEAGIAAEHCMAKTIADTRWDRVVECYLLLESIAPSPLHTLNRAVATAEWKGPEQGLELLEGLQPPTWLAGSYLWAAVLADLHGRCGHAEEAVRYQSLALDTAPTAAVKTLLARRFAASG